jgi:hypothetical protein
MNERIRDIAEHCDFYVGNEHYDKSHEEKQRLFMERFAELIVRECCEVAHCNFHVDGLTLGGILKEHFGVQE